MKKEIKLTLTGNVPGKKNMYHRGRGKSFYKDQKVKDFEEDTLWQIKQQVIKKQVKGEIKMSDIPFLGEVEIEIIFNISGRNKDLDNGVGTIFDILQGAGIITNDKQVFALGVKKVLKTKEDITNIIIREL
jgi:Holliday junction resolvase RusA-like endonuclease